MPDPMNCTCFMQPVCRTCGCHNPAPAVLASQAPGPLPDPFAQRPPSSSAGGAAAVSPAELGDGGFMADGGEGEAPPMRRKPPKIFYATRTHSQIQQVRLAVRLHVLWLVLHAPRW